MRVLDWTKILAGAAVLPAAMISLTTFAGCGDDDGGGDGECVPSPHQECPGDDSPKLTDPEGGTIFFERMHFSTELQEAAGFPPAAFRVMAQFTSSMPSYPETGRLPLPKVGECNNFAATPMWFSATDSAGTYVDIGDLVIDHPDGAITIEKNTTREPDMLARVHDIYYQYFGPGEIDRYTTPDAYQDVTFTGSADYPATTFENAMYMPPDYEPVDPPFGAAQVQLGEDYEANWELVEPANPDIESLGFAILLAPDGATVHHFCPDVNDGSVTIDAATLDTFAAEFPDGALMIRGNFTHNIVRFDDGKGNDDRRIDMVAINCFIQPIGFLPAE